MKYLKLGIVICGALGLAGMLMGGIGEMLADKKAGTIVMLAAFGLPMVMAVTGLVKPPFQAWQAGVCLACFALALFKLRIWDLIEMISKTPPYWTVMLIGATLGAIASVITVLRPEGHV